ncbi:MAG: 16S rRNA (uracil(1498)-N(3))-methyltransferase, partial [Mizugakiibacter sp.]|uniref:16S rRNA (uracil(1498)-N(3))-methyltransferase n=1 Tax=Mizugakiibacter sp. TaxID=1972610 RepID=UPI00320D57D8
MRQIRIHVAAPLAEGAEVTLPEQAGEHVARVLRLGVGDAVVLFDGGGHDYAATLISIARRAVTARVDARCDALPESPLRLTLVQGIARGEKMDLIVQKATELGAARIVPIVSERTEVRLDGERADKRLAHWRAVAVSACEQSGRARLPGIDAPLTLDAWLAALPDDGAARLALLPQ